ncbi:MAG: ribosome biogenesis GTP-binding protein YihA/YsxC [Candidatus Binatia bacterium]
MPAPPARRPPGRAEFVAGAARLERIPPPSRPEVAFAGRSNVGKSSLLNRLVGRRALARVSRTPGRTQQINFFAIDKGLLLVDLPGYGFARVPLAVKAEWRGLVEGYLTKRRTLRGVVVLVDARRGLQAEDAQLLDFLAAGAIPALVVATKIDKLKRSERGPALAAIAEQQHGLPPIAFSALSGEGTDDLWVAVGAWLER